MKVFKITALVNMLCFLILSSSLSAQHKLVHTRLDLEVDYAQQILRGKAWITLTSDSLSVILDAKGMRINQVGLNNNKQLIPLHFTYNDGQRLYIDLPRSHAKNYTLFIDYETVNLTPQGNWKPALHFINPTGIDKGMPVQVWTSGQPENNSSWFPTLDKPNQKTTQQISLTVPSQYVTLSNGVLISSNHLKNGLRKDTWKLALPHAPYLSMFAVGDFKIVKDHWKGKEVSYYIEPQFAANEQTVRAGFPDTPEAMDYFSKLLGVDYPWNKYSQIKLRGFSGAMENTTAAAFNEDGQGSLREIQDKNYEPGNIHELFHQWFGNYVTAESWANISLNESFADLSEILWAAHKYNADVADDHLYKGAKGYLENEAGWNKDLVRFKYDQPQEVFDGVSYQKGGRILNMLRHYLGDSAFNLGMQIYLKNNAFKAAAVQHLRIAMEEASGKDLNWFFNQWFYGSGHPVIDISYQWNAKKSTMKVIVKQPDSGKIFVFPLKVDVYLNGNIRRYEMLVKTKSDTLSFASAGKPQLVNADAEKILLANKTDHKNIVEYAFQLLNAPLFMDRLEAVQAAGKILTDTNAVTILVSALNDPYYGIRTRAIDEIDFGNQMLKEKALPVLLRLAHSDPNHPTRANALNKIGQLRNPGYFGLFKQSLDSKSYLVQGESLRAIGLIDQSKQFELAKLYQKDSKGKLLEVILEIYISRGGQDQWKFIYESYTAGYSPLRYAFTTQFAAFLERIQNPLLVKQGVIALQELISIQKRFYMVPRVMGLLNHLKQIKDEQNDLLSVETINQSIIQINKLVITQASISQ